MEIVSQ